jgi:hypothetical protein
MPQELHLQGMQLQAIKTAGFVLLCFTYRFASTHLSLLMACTYQGLRWCITLQVSRVGCCLCGVHRWARRTALWVRP